MKHRILFTIGMCLTLFCSTATFAQDADPDEETSDLKCRERAEMEMRKEHLLYRSMLYGQSKAEDARVMEQRYASDGSLWYKWDEGQWQSQSEGYEGTTWSDTFMNDMMQPPPRKGLFETKGVLTTELIPYIGQSIRAFDCRLRLIPEWTRKSISAEEGRRLKLFAPGCKMEVREALKECLHSAAGDDKAFASDATSHAAVVAEDLFEQELALTLMAVHYDAGYRSLLQFAGNMDNSLKDLRWPLLGTLRRAVALVGNFGRIPCFTSSCDAFPPPEEEPELP